MKKEQSRIPTSKVQRATRFVKTGLKVGGNYLKHYSRSLAGGEVDSSQLNRDNAEDIYSALSELKGSALKVAQMLSMDKGVLPAEFANKFSESQHKAPPLSGPLIVKTFQQYFEKSPQQLFDRFEMQAAHAASIGQVHRAWKGDKVFAVKIQYPGVGESVLSDLKMIKPFARQLFGWKDMDMQYYFEEVQDRLLEETDYTLELERSQYLSEQCKDLENLFFATYYPEFSAERVICMSWLEGQHMDAFLAENPSQEIRNQVGQALWDFYNFQVHRLKTMHADAHPGNFLFRQDGTVGILDFGCVKTLPEDFYKSYFRLLKPGTIEDRETFLEICKDSNIIFEDDTPEEVEVYSGIFKEALGLVCQPFYSDRFDFGNDEYFDAIYAYGEKARNMPELLRSKAPRGAKDGIYMNRAYFGLYSILNALKAEVQTLRYLPDWER